MKKAVIFDLDGTLLDTLGDILIAVNGMLEEFGFPAHTREELMTMIGDGARKMMQRAVPKNVARHNTLVDRCLNRYTEIYRHTALKTEPFPQVSELVNGLKEKGVKLAVLSNKPHADAVTVVQNTLPGCFDLVIGQSDEFPVKPNPKGLQHILDTLQVSAQECLYVGDGEMDYLTPTALSVPCVSALWGYRTREQLEKVGATVFATSPKNVWDFL